ncbi:MAG: hypothetical protein A2Y62_06420 [Candidatus Fischerbacteria bacterium RBG_13_37_8]|uniref:Uncharacterized protein n=1 Tax=Candidatus Fischerbacteria bacterium RBG_13_37_8 TaxID=1817863 RepID=A0A1F5VQQ1_9BACT|nr:MAG: hypothetical protein A2Y62_06420 [Candidatus Fischerbacteria bacterium RBG_13_37_8]
MYKTKITILLILLLLPLWALAGKKEIVVFKLDSVTREPKAEPEPQITEKLIYEDDLIKIMWVPGKEAFSFMLENRTDKLLKILWEESSLITQAGESHRVIHAGVKFINQDQPMPPTMVPQKANIKDLIASSDCPHVKPAKIMGTYCDSEIYSDKLPKSDQIGEREKALQQVLRVVLTIQKEEQKYIYDFTFKAEKGEK